METVRYEVTRVRARELVDQLVEIGYETAIAPGLSPQGEAVVEVSGADPKIVHAVVRERVPDARRI